MYSLPQSYNQTSKCKRCISSNAYDESLTSLAKKIPDLLDYSDRNGVIDYSDDINTQLYTLFGIDDKNRQHIQKILASKKSD